MPQRPSLETLGSLVAERRGKVGVRVTAKRIGISPATLSRVENGHLPDLENFGKICRWLEIDPSTLLDVRAEGRNHPVVSVHFRKGATMARETASALSELILAAQAALVADQNRST